MSCVYEYASQKEVEKTGKCFETCVCMCLTICMYTHVYVICVWGCEQERGGKTSKCFENCVCVWVWLHACTRTFVHGSIRIFKHEMLLRLVFEVRSHYQKKIKERKKRLDEALTTHMDIHTHTHIHETLLRQISRMRAHYQKKIKELDKRLEEAVATYLCMYTHLYSRLPCDRCLRYAHTIKRRLRN